MQIGPPSNEGSVPPRRGDERGRGRTQETRPLQEDIFELSEDGRNKLAERADNALRAERPREGETGVGKTSEPRPVGKDKLERVHRRILSGFYDQLEIKRQIADSLIDDIDP